MDSPAHTIRPPLAIHELREGVERNEIDTVLVVFPDLAGSWKGKRMTGRFFLDDTVLHGIEACNYLIATDVEMNVLPDYRFANWDAGYGDMRCVPDFATLRLIPWLEKTALVICDLACLAHNHVAAVRLDQRLAGGGIDHSAQNRAFQRATFGFWVRDQGRAVLLHGVDQTWQHWVRV